MNRSHDLSEGMARQRAAGRPEASALVGDATDLGEWAGRCAAVVSVFGLQQLPDPAFAIRSWYAALAPRSSATSTRRTP